MGILKYLGGLLRRKKPTPPPEEQPKEDEIIRGQKPFRAYSLLNKKKVYVFAMNKTQNTVLVSRSRSETNARWIPADKITPYKERRKYK